MASSHLAKDGLIFLSSKAPGAKLVLRWLRQRGAPVFMFHRILPVGSATYAKEMVTSTELFDAFLEWTCRHYQVLPLEALLQIDDPAKRNACCSITFDDGWQDNYEYALPLLKKHRVTATIFLAVRFIGSSRQFWQDRISYSLNYFSEQNCWPAEAAMAEKFPWAKALTLQKGFLGIRDRLMQRSSSEVEDFADFLLAQVPRREDSKRSFLTWDEVNMMKSAGIQFGSHTLNHVLLTNSDLNTASMEILHSKHELQERLGTPISTFAYPWGRSNNAIEAEVRQAGYKIAVTTHESLLGGDVNPYSIPRVFISDSILTSGSRDFEASRLEFHMARLGCRSNQRDLPPLASAASLGSTR